MAESKVSSLSHLSKINQFQSRRDVKQLTNVSKNLFINISVFQLEASRLYKLDSFQELIHEIKMFNSQLQKWRKNQGEIKNLRLTYSLYQNLYSRLKYISSFSKSHDQSLTAISRAQQWFFYQKPKIRCQVKQTQANMKKHTASSHQGQKLQKILQSNIIKRQMQAYQMMSRTAHPGFFPPKQHLKQFKRKQFLPFSLIQHEQNRGNGPLTAKKSTSASLLSKNRLSKFRMSVGTLVTSATSLKQTKNNFNPKNTITEFKIAQQKTQNQNMDHKILDQKELQQLQIKQKQKQQQLDQIQRQKKVEKQEIMQQNLVQQLGEQDGPDADDQNIYQDQQIKNRIKKYAIDYDPQQTQYIKQMVKENEQSTLRRVMKVNQQKIRSKLEDLDIKRNMLNWGKIKGKNNRDRSRKLQGLLHGNKYQNLAFKQKTVQQIQNFVNRNNKIMSSTVGFKEQKQTKQPIEVPMLFRSKSSHPTAMQSDIQKLKIKQMFRTYGKYINHLPGPSTASEVPEQQSEKKTGRTQQSFAPPQIRAMSLTCLSSVGKKKNFSNVLNQNDPDSYNQTVQDEVIRIKTSLAKRGSALEKGTIYKALSVNQPEQIHTSIGFYTAGRDLLSNPFFPKTVAKKKKKK